MLFFFIFNSGQMCGQFDKDYSADTLQSNMAWSDYVFQPVSQYVMIKQK